MNESQGRGMRVIRPNRHFGLTLMRNSHFSTIFLKIKIQGRGLFTADERHV